MFIWASIIPDPEKNDQCSLDPKKGFCNVPQFCLHNLINTLNIMSRNVLKSAIKEQLKMFCILKYIFQALTFKYVGDC